MKRVLAFILALVMTMSLFTVCGFAAGSTGNSDMEVNPPEGKTMTDLAVGDTVTVVLKNKAMTVSSFACGVAFDKERFTCESIVGTGKNPNKYYLTDEYDETVANTAASKTTESNNTGTVGFTWGGTEDTNYVAGTIATITFTVKGIGTAAPFTLYEDSDGTDGMKSDSIMQVEAKAFAYLDELASCVITAPAKDGTPQMDLSHMGGVKYTGAITWTPAVSGTFAPGTKYTAHVTLTANDGYKFPSNVTAGCTGGTIKKGSVSLTDGGKTLTFDVEFAETEKAAKLGGTVMISGQAMFGYTLTADTSALNYNGEEQGTLRYQWKRNGDAIEGAEDRSYKLVQEDIGHNISVEVWNSNNTGSVTSTSAVLVQKALNGEIPDAPTFDSKTANSITISYAEGNYEFACVPAGTTTISQDAWQDGKTFTGLMPNREYDIYARVKESETHKASPASTDKLTVTTELGTADEELQTQLKRAVVVLNREYSGTYTLPVDVQGSLPAGWRVEYSKDNVTFSTSISSIRDVSESGKYYVKFINDDYKPYVADFDVKITPKDISLKDGKTIVTANYDEPIYTGSAVEPTNLKLYWATGKELVVGTDVTIAYSNNINRPNGTITVTAKADGNFTGSCPVYFTIRPMTITPYAESIPAVTYTGGKLYPHVTVRTEGGTALVLGKDYGVSYTNNTDVGTGTATIRSISDTVNTSNYTFTTFHADFQITRAKFPGTTTGSMNVRSREITTNVQYRLPAILGVEGAEYGDVTTEGDLIAEAHLDTDGRTLIFSTRAKDADTEGKIKIEITQGTNYFADTFVLTVTAKDKDDADVKIDTSKPANVTYGDTFTVTASAATPGTAAGSWTWESSDPSILEIVSGGDTATVTVKAVKASNTGATLTAKYSSETHEDTDTRTYTVAQKPITVSGFGVKAREYNGKATVYDKDVTGYVRVFGAVEGDEVFVQFATGTYDAKDAGSRTATLNLVLTGKDLGNYVLEDQTYTVENAQITPKEVTIGGAAVQPSKIYDGTTDADITSTSTSYTVVNAVAGDKVNVDSANIKASYESKDVGTDKDVTFSGFSLTGDDAKNYKLTAQPTTTADITRRTLTVTGITVADKTYDGGTDAQITNITYGNIVSGDQVYARIIASFADANADTNKAITFNVDSLAGKDARNYQLYTSTLPAATATIRKAQLVGAPAFEKVTKTGITLREFTDAGGVITAGVRGVNGENISYQFIWTDQEDTVIEANKSYAWTIKSFDSNYEDLTGSTVLYPVSTSYSDQVKKQSEEFEAKKRGELPEDELDFRDVYEDDYFFDAVQWAAENGITGGVGNGRFGPNLDCSRGQTMTFLWRASGEPKPDAISTDLTDVAAGSYYYEAVLWAMQEGVTTGAGAGRFAPDATVTRGQFVTFLYRLAGASSDGVHPFADVPAGSYYEKAIAWAFAEGITRGTSGTTFSPDAPCTRAQIITFLYRYFNR